MLLEPGDPLAIELVDHGVNPVAFEPTIRERAAVECWTRDAFGEPRVLAKEVLEAIRAFDVLAAVKDRRHADVNFPVAVVVQLQGKVRPLPPSGSSPVTRFREQRFQERLSGTVLSVC